ncbi:alanine racemase [Actinosynnema pretiosum subsp. pretiosum]|uniref:Alanine racemase domain protein n=2 Tax=Actinosynnema TaxID=40566 RepID=C6WMH3_ACTMD|nr:alanine racemase [Actinosynnema mirum]ACU36502.1 alanine racemase domain protein [Actinosynnema mirum DSM 43827]AXX29958.1 Type III PLP / low-specificity D-threonine aldolase [Actinosynnema pretiosum subsp. pretiosum]QUF05855.1 alanine racemase [Actinosynnema pretiosum subsp. pretiosum]
MTPPTPHLRLDREVLRRNADRLRARITALGPVLRPHVKTSKSPRVAEVLLGGAPGPITVSTLREAEVFADAGYDDVLYAVGIAPSKLDRVRALRERGVDLVVLLDSVEQAEAVAGQGVPALLEVDCDGHRGGVPPDSPAVLEIAGVLGGDLLRGVLTHAGESYFRYTPEELALAAEHERATAVRVAEALRAGGFPCPVVSVGSTPTAHAARDLTGVTEVRAGNYAFFDLVMAGVGVCGLADLALSVVVTVIGHRRERGWIMTDGGWMATSRDRGTGVQAVDQAYGVVALEDGGVVPDLLMVGASQEHGVLGMREGSARELPDFPVGTRLRVLPVHACATAAQHGEYHVVGGGRAPEVWARVTGW